MLAEKRVSITVSAPPSRFIKFVPLRRRRGDHHDKQLFLHVSAHVEGLTTQSDLIETVSNYKKAMESVVKTNPGR